MQAVPPGGKGRARHSSCAAGAGAVWPLRDGPGWRGPRGLCQRGSRILVCAPADRCDVCVDGGTPFPLCGCFPRRRPPRLFPAPLRLHVPPSPTGGGVCAGAVRQEVGPGAVWRDPGSERADRHAASVPWDDPVGRVHPRLHRQPRRHDAWVCRACRDDDDGDPEDNRRGEGKEGKGLWPAETGVGKGESLHPSPGRFVDSGGGRQGERRVVPCGHGGD